jgi:hypothetical protein
MLQHRPDHRPRVGEWFVAEAQHPVDVQQDVAGGRQQFDDVRTELQMDPCDQSATLRAGTKEDAP